MKDFFMNFALSDSKMNEIANRDLRRSAFHEAGHLVVAEHYKLKGEARVSRTVDEVC